MFSLIVSSNPIAWETDQLMRMQAERFKEYSDGVEAKQVSSSEPDTLRLLENTPALLMYESGSEAQSIKKVRFGLLYDINRAGEVLTFRFAQEGTFQRKAIQEFADRLGIDSWEFNRTHWAIKDGALPSALMAKLRRPRAPKPAKAVPAQVHSNSPYRALSSWNSHSVAGAKFDLEKGVAVTGKSAKGLPGYWFSADSTVVLGRSVDGPGFESPSESVVSWNVPVPIAKPARFEATFLVIGCLRRFGGLHSREYDKRADIYVNGKQVDGFALRIRPEGHSDFFHRPPLPASLPMLAPFGHCQTVYAWPLADGVLEEELKGQRVTVRIDREVRWDVDYVGFVTQKANTAPNSLIEKLRARHVVAAGGFKSYFKRKSGNEAPSAVFSKVCMSTDQQEIGSLTRNPANDSLFLSLSGGGFRATLFHLGMFLFLSETNRLKKVSGVVSVSGGSILAGHLVNRWLEATNSHDGFDSVAADLVAFTRTDLRNSVIIPWLWSRIFPLNWFRRSQSLTGRLKAKYDLHFKGQTLGELNRAGHPFLAMVATDSIKQERIAFTATDILRFQIASRCRLPGPIATGVPLALAVTASSCFPPVFSRMLLTNHDLGLNYSDFKDSFSLNDGGVTDNLGLAVLLELKSIGQNLGSRVIACNAERSLRDKPGDGPLTDQAAQAAALSNAALEQIEKELGHSNVSLIRIIDRPGKPLGLPFLVQKQLAVFRTDLDAPSWEEIQALLLHGFSCAAKTIAEATYDSMSPEDGGSRVLSILKKAGCQNVPKGPTVTAVEQSHKTPKAKVLMHLILLLVLVIAVSIGAFKIFGNSSRQVIYRPDRQWLAGKYFIGFQTLSQVSRKPVWDNQWLDKDEVVVVAKCNGDLRTAANGLVVVAFWRLATGFVTNWHVARRGVGGSYKLAVLNADATGPGEWEFLLGGIECEKQYDGAIGLVLVALPSEVVEKSESNWLDDKIGWGFSDLPTNILISSSMKTIITKPVR